MPDVTGRMYMRDMAFATRRPRNGTTTRAAVPYHSVLTTEQFGAFLTASVYPIRTTISTGTGSEIREFAPLPVQRLARRLARDGKGVPL